MGRSRYGRGALGKLNKQAAEKFGNQDPRNPYRPTRKPVSTKALRPDGSRFRNRQTELANSAPAYARLNSDGRASQIAQAIIRAYRVASSSADEPSEFDQAVEATMTQLKISDSDRSSAQVKAGIRAARRALNWARQQLMNDTA